MNLHCLFFGHRPCYVHDAENLMSSDPVERALRTYMLGQTFLLPSPPGLKRVSAYIAICRDCGVLYRYNLEEDSDTW